MSQMTPKDFLWKCDWEGGGLYEGFQYGLSPENLDDSNQEYKQAVKEAYECFLKFDAAVNRAENILSSEDFEQ